MPQPHKGQVHIDRPLTNISTAYMQEQRAFVSDRAFPSVPVQKQSDLYFEYSKHDFLRSVAQLRAPGSESAGGGYNLSTASYSALVLAVHKDVDEQTRANSDDPLNADADATRWVSYQMMLKREIDWAAKYFATGVWTSNTEQTGVASDTPTANQFEQWDRAGSTPIVDITRQMGVVLGATGYLPNKMVVPWNVFNTLRNHPDFTDRIKYTGGMNAPAVVVAQAMAQVLGLEEVLVAESVRNTSVEGNATQTVASILGKAALLVYCPPSPGLLVPSAGYTFAWTGLLGAGATGARIKRIPLPTLEADRIEGEMAYDQKIVGNDLGVFLASAIG